MTHDADQTDRSREGWRFLGQLTGRLLAIVGLLFALHMIAGVPSSPSGLAGLVCGMGIGQILFKPRHAPRPSAGWIGMGMVMVFLATTGAYGIAGAIFSGN